MLKTAAPHQATQLEPGAALGGAPKDGETAETRPLSRPPPRADLGEAPKDREIGEIKPLGRPPPRAGLVRAPKDREIEKTKQLGPPVPRATAKATRFEAGVVIGHYEIIRPLGRGGMGQVVLARDTRLGRRVALKFLVTVDRERLARFQIEAKATAQLAHESIVALHDIGEHEGMPFMVLEYVPGKSLSDWLEERADGEGVTPGLPPVRAAELMLPVANALACAHAAGIVHRDLKPGNIMLADSGKVRVLDFGIAKLLEVEGAPEAARDAGPRDEEGAARGELTEAGRTVGTQRYMAPEQWRGGPVDGRADLWAVGLILYRLVAGEHPLAGLSSGALMTVALLEEPIPSVRERLPDIGPLGAVIDRCLVKRAEDRLGSAQELAEALSAIVRPHASATDRGAEDENPYAGLSAFQERDAARFFGREALVEQVVTRLAEQPLVALVGSSGTGKSSLARAGVIPALKRGGDAWEAFVLRPGPHPLSALAELLVEARWQRSSGSSSSSDDSASDRTLSAASSLESQEGLTTRLKREPGLLGAQARARARRRRERVLLFIDQFEEVFTLSGGDERDAFLASLAGAADDPSSPVRILLSVRHDFLDRVASDGSALSELVSRGAVLVGPLGREDLSRALIEPARLRSYRFESDALVTEALDALAGASSPLPLLQFTAAKLWEGRDRERRLLTKASYKAFGGVSGALAGHADSVLGAMSSSERRSARALLLRLVTPERTRAVLSRRELLDVGGAARVEPAGAEGAEGGLGAATVARVLDRLIDARLLAVEGAGGEENTVELVHESLIATWPALSRWLDEEQDDAQLRARLRAAAREWEASGFTEGLLWRDEAAEEARRWSKRKGRDAGAELPAREARYLVAMLALDERARKRRRRWVAGLFAALSCVVLVVSALAVQSRRAARAADAQAQRADAQRAEAERSAAGARNATRMAAARSRQADPTTVLALLREVESGSSAGAGASPSISLLPQRWAELARWARGAVLAEAVLLHEVPVNSASFSPDGKRIVSASDDKLVRVWNADGSGTPLVLRGHEDIVFSAAFDPDGKRIVSASSDRTVRVWNADGKGPPLVLRGHDDVVRGATWSPDGKRIVSASIDKTVRVWNADGEGQPLVFRGHGEVVNSAAFSPDGERIVSASKDRTVRVWNADGSGQPVVLKGHEGFVWSAAFSPDGRRIVSASSDKTVRVWNADGAGQPVILKGHENVVRSAAFDPDSQRIISASDDKTVRLWSADVSGQALVLRGHEDVGVFAAFSPDGKRVVSASEDKTVRVWNLRGADRPLVLEGHQEQVYSASFSPDGKRIVSASIDKTVRVWNADGSGQPLVLRGHEGPVIFASWSPDGRRVVSASDDKTVRVWNADGTGQPLVLRGHGDNASWAAFSPDGQRIVSASADKTVRVWNADGSGQPFVQAHEDRVLCAAFSPDGQRIVSASADRTVRVWNADGSGTPLVLRGHDGQVYGAAFSQDGRRIVSVSQDKTARVWNADGSGQPLVQRHDSAVYAASFGPDGRRIASASIDGAVRVWNTDGTGEPLVLRASNMPVNDASWSADGQRIVAASDDKTVIVWSDLTPLSGVDDPSLWVPTSYCLPIADRERLLGFSEAQNQADLERCERRVRELQQGVGAPGR